ncbi:MAG: hypothetical protein KGJ13_03270 [Patescibacteria group bacterium]|nr:hypothetical protein [Patescibacteria group bacterium]
MKAAAVLFFAPVMVLAAGPEKSVHQCALGAVIWHDASGYRKDLTDLDRYTPHELMESWRTYTFGCIEVGTDNILVIQEFGGSDEGLKPSDFAVIPKEWVEGIKLFTQDSDGTGKVRPFGMSFVRKDGEQPRLVSGKKKVTRYKPFVP